MDKADVLKRLTEAIVDGNAENASKAAEDALKLDIDPLETLEQGGAKGLDIIGEKFQRCEAFLPQLILAGESMKAAMDILTPKMAEKKEGRAARGKVVLGTIQGDIHDLGKNLVAAMLSVNRFEVHDLGVQIPPKKFIEKARELNANIIGISSLLTTSAYFQADVIKYLNDMGLRDKYYVIVGGGPTSKEWAAKIGADGYGRLATDAVKVCKMFMEEAGPPPLGSPIAIGEQR